jgi:glutamate/tyrosine decarboxylase-like PLP-dependent enzyme
MEPRLAKPTSLDPDDWDALRREGHRMLDAMIDYQRTLRERPLWRPIPAEVRDRHRTAPPAHAMPLAEAQRIFFDDVAAYPGGNLHPGFMGWVQGGGTPMGMLGEMLAAGLNANLGGRDHMPIAIEAEVVGWARQMFGFPDTAGGLFVTGASQANLIGVLVARNQALTPAVRKTGVLAAGRRLTGYASTGAHSCVTRAMEMAGLGSDNLRLVGVDADRRADVAAIAAAIAADRAAGFAPFMIVASAGTVDAGAVDDLAALADLAEREGLWLHVDGAFGAMGVLSDDIRPRLAGLERADSLALDFHKWAQIPYDAGFVMVRDGAAQRATFAAQAAYLQRETRGLAGGDWWPCDDGPDLSRGFRALKTWFTFRTVGTQAMSAMIDRCCALARRAEVRIRAEPRLQLLAPAQLNIVCFRYRPEGSIDGEALNELTHEIVATLHERGRVAPSLTRLEGRAAIRAAIFNHRTDETDIDALIDETLAVGETLAAARR